MKLRLAFDRDELNAMQYPVMVEMWDRLNKRKRKLYNEEFTEAERDTISRYYRLFYDWYLRRGTPEEHVMARTTYELLNRAIAFFASL